MNKQGSQKDTPRSRKQNHIRMGAKVTSQLNTNQQSNMVLSAYCVVTQTSSTVNIHLG